MCNVNGRVSIRGTYDAVGCSIYTQQFENINVLQVHHSLQKHCVTSDILNILTHNYGNPSFYVKHVNNDYEAENYRKIIKMTTMQQKITL